MTMPDDAITAAQVSLREATRALANGDGHHTVRTGLDSHTAGALASDVAHTLDAVAAVLRHVSFGPVPTSAPTSPASLSVQVLIHQICEGADMAWRISGTEAHAARCGSRTARAQVARPDD